MPMKIVKTTKNYEIVEQEDLILHPLLRQTKSGKISTVKRNYLRDKEKNVVVNNFVPTRKFNKNLEKLPQTKRQLLRYIDKNFRKKSKRAAKLELYLTNPKKYKIKEALSNTKIITKAMVSSVLLTGALYLAVNYGPGLYVTFENWLQAQFRPQSIEAPEFNINDVIGNGAIKDNNVNTNTDNIPDENKTIQSITLSETCLNSYDLFKKGNLAYVMEMYLGDNREITPLFLHPETRADGSEALKIYCKLGESEIVMFEYDILEGMNKYTYDDLFNSSSISPSDVINSLSILASDEFIADLPQTCPIINFEDCLYAYTTGAKSEVKGDIIDGEFVEQNIYAFSIITLEKNGQILQKDIEISKEKAETLEGFDPTDPYSLVRIYAQNQEDFNLEATYEVDYNMPTIILYNANQQLIENKTETQIENLNTSTNNDQTPNL